MADHDAETWAEWLGIRIPMLVPLVTRADLLDDLADRGITLDERTLRHWEARGVLPRPVRQSLYGVVRATYPRRAVDAVAAIYALRQVMPLRQVIPVARHIYATTLSADLSPWIGRAQ